MVPTSCACAHTKWRQRRPRTEPNIFFSLHLCVICFMERPLQINKIGIHRRVLFLMKAPHASAEAFTFFSTPPSQPFQAHIRVPHSPTQYPLSHFQIFFLHFTFATTNVAHRSFHFLLFPFFRNFSSGSWYCFSGCHCCKSTWLLKEEEPELPSSCCRKSSTFTLS